MEVRTKVEVEMGVEWKGRWRRVGFGSDINNGGGGYRGSGGTEVERAIETWRGEAAGSGVEADAGLVGWRRRRRKWGCLRI